MAELRQSDRDHHRMQTWFRHSPGNRPAYLSRISSSSNHLWWPRVPVAITSARPLAIPNFLAKMYVQAISSRFSLSPAKPENDAEGSASCISCLPAGTEVQLVQLRP